MIIMRALVATVLLIAVMLVSIVLINANTRTVRDAEGKEVLTKEKSSGHDQPRIEVEVVESFENVELADDEVGKVEEKVSEEVVEQVGGAEKEGRLISVIKTSGKDLTPTAVLVEIDSDDSDEELGELVEGTVEEVLFTDGFTVDSESHEDATDANRNETATEQTKQSEEGGLEEIEIVEVDTPEDKPEEKRLQSKPVQEIKARSKESRVVSTTETQPASVPMGYEPSSYIIMDEEPLVEVSKDSESEDEDIDPTETDAGTKVLERKQRHADRCPETIILNEVPIVPYIEEPRRSLPHRFPPLKSSRLSKRDVSSQHDPDHGHIRHQHQHHHHQHQHYNLQQGAAQKHPSVYNPYNWGEQNMNELRFPQCAACQKKAVPVCRTCGQCAECCHKSGCTCGCLHP